MSTFPFPPGGHEPSGLPELATVSRVERPPLVDHELCVSPGAVASDVSSALVTMPADAVFVDHYGDVEVTLVFREVPTNQ
ncbi:hypothetical protein [Frankia sp. Cas4]|uniref:hypothetical protein n=1 Tax=Frankia sp. Cas4 TaxID=3073927 RepID=UPI002AD209D8|nr:hypothetical protein [Frankia sp. Cas4]